MKTMHMNDYVPVTNLWKSQRKRIYSELRRTVYLIGLLLSLKIIFYFR